MKNAITYVGLDAHKKAIYVAMLMGHERLPVTWQLANEPTAVRRLVRKLERAAGDRCGAVMKRAPAGTPCNASSRPSA